MSDATVVSALDSLLEPLIGCLDSESARRVAELRVTESVQQRVEALAERANEGQLSDAERNEYEALVSAADFISILQLKAMRSLDSTERS